MKLITHNDLHLKHRYRAVSWEFRLLLLILVVKPIFNTLEDVSLGLPVSVLQLLGFFVLILLMRGIFNSRVSFQVTSSWRLYMPFFFLYLINLLFVLFNYPDIGSLRLLLKSLTIPLIFIYFSKNLRNRLDLELVLNAVLVSAVPLIIVFVYDTVFVGSFQETRGVDRLESSFGDIATIGIQVNMIWSVFLYKLLKEPQLKFQTLLLTLSFFVFAVVALVSIAHGTSFAVFVVTTGLFLLSYSQRSFFFLLVLGLLLVGPFFFFAGDWLQTFFQSFYGKEYEALASGTNLTDSNALFHGRMGRWKRLWGLFESQNGINKLIGGLAIEHPFIAGHGTHNDYLRVLFTTGYVGFLFYFLFLLNTVRVSLGKVLSYRYLGGGCVLIFTIYGIALTPSTYIDLNFLLMAVFVFNALRH